MNRYTAILLFTLHFCVSCKEDVKKEPIEKRRVTEAKWMFYESNFQDEKTICSRKGLEVLDINICFIDSISYTEKYIGDTLEIVVHPFMNDYKRCFPEGDGCLNLFGFFPNIDTVSYRANEDATITKRIIENDSITASFSWMGVNTRAIQKPLFREFIIKNKDKIYSWLKKEATKRGYI